MLRLSILVLVAMLLDGCRVASRAPSLEAEVFDDGAVAETTDVRIRRGALDVARLRSGDDNVYQPSFRVLEDPYGRLRLIVQDPITHRYKYVR